MKVQRLQQKWLESLQNFKNRKGTLREAYITIKAVTVSAVAAFISVRIVN